MNSHSFSLKKRSIKLFLSLIIMMGVILGSLLFVVLFQREIIKSYIPKHELVITLKNKLSKIDLDVDRMYNLKLYNDTVKLYQSIDSLATLTNIMISGGHYAGKTYMKHKDKDILSELNKLKDAFFAYKISVKSVFKAQQNQHYYDRYYSQYKQFVSVCGISEEMYHQYVIENTTYIWRLLFLVILIAVILFVLMILLIHSYLIKYQETNTELTKSNTELLNHVEENTALFEQLNRNNAFLTELLKNLNGGILFEDTNRKVVYVSEQFIRIFKIENINVEKLIGADCANNADYAAEMFVDKVAFLNNIQNCVLNKKAEHDIVFELKDGRVLERDYIPIYKSNEFQGHLWHYRDITEQINIQKQIEESEKHYRYLFNQNPNPMWIYDTETIMFLEVNEAAINKYGYTAEEFKNMNILKIRPGSEYEKTIQAVEQSKNKHFNIVNNFKHLTKAGNVIEVDIFTNNIQYNKRPCRFVMINDITEQNKAKNELLNYQNQLEQAVQEKTRELLKTNLKLETSNRQMNLALQAGKMAWWEWNRQTGYVEYSPLKAELLDYTEKEIGNTVEGFTKLVHPAFYESTMQAMRDLLTGEKNTFDTEYKIQKRNGEYIWFKDLGQVIDRDPVTEQPIRIAGITQDVTRQKEIGKENRLWLTLIQNANWGVYITKVNSYELAFLNQTFARMHGYTVDELLNNDCRMLIADEMMTSLPEWIDEIHDKGNFSFESVNVRKDGTKFPVQVSVTIVLDTETYEEYVVASVQDISEQVEYENKLEQKRERLETMNEELFEFSKKLKHSEHQFRTLISNLPDIDVYLFDKDLRFIIADGTEMKKLGFSSKTFEGRRLNEITELDPETRSELTKLYQSIIDGRYQINEIEYDDNYYYHQGIPLRNDKGEIYGGIYFGQNITKIKEAEQKIQILYNELQKQNNELKSINEEYLATNEELINANERLYNTKEELILEKEKYRIISENFPDGRVMLFDQNLRYYLVEGLGTPNFYFDAKELINHTIYEALPPTLVEFLEPYYLKALKGIRSNFEFSYQNAYIEMQIVPIKKKDNKITAGMIIAHDITDRKTAELKTMQALQKEKELNEFKSGFISMASHQFRTPLAAIQSSIDILKIYFEKLELKDDSMFVKHYNRINSEIKRLTELMTDILIIGRHDSGKTPFAPVLTDAVKLITGLIQSHFSNLPDGKTMHLISEINETQMLLDTKLITHALSNLISNAVKYSRTKCEVLIKTKNNYLIILISDDGIGIPKEEQPMIFGTFFRASNVTQFQGTGLGLVIVKQFIELHEGTVEFNSIPNEKTTFTVKIPIKI